jgi:hypothetical protein
MPPAAWRGVCDAETSSQCGWATGLGLGQPDQKSCGPGTRCWCQVSRRFLSVRPGARSHSIREATVGGDGGKKELVTGECAK